MPIMNSICSTYYYYYKLQTVLDTTRKIYTCTQQTVETMQCDVQRSVSRNRVAWAAGADRNTLMSHVDRVKAHTKTDIFC